MSLCINPNCSNTQNTDNVLFCQNCGSEILLKQLYRVIRQIGSGSFGKTYEVRESYSSKVLKVLTNNSPKAVELFQREAQILSQLNHPGIPKVEADAYFIFHPKDSQQPLHCLLMEKIEGVNLREFIKQRGNRPIGTHTAIKWLKELIEILQEIHKRGIIHRDIKPQNLILKPDGHLTLIDFGGVKEEIGIGTGTEVSTNVSGGTSIRSAGYTPNEQLHGQAVAQSDFFALGRTLIYLLTAKEPTDAALYDAYNDVLNWRPYAPDVLPKLADLIDNIMARLPRDRPENTQVILRRLEEIEKSKPQPVSSSHPTENAINQDVTNNNNEVNNQNGTILLELNVSLQDKEFSKAKNELFWHRLITEGLSLIGVIIVAIIVFFINQWILSLLSVFPYRIKMPFEYINICSAFIIVASPLLFFCLLIGLIRIYWITDIKQNGIFYLKKEGIELLNTIKNINIAKLVWADMNIYESENNFILWKKLEISVIPKRCFLNQEQLESFKKIVQSKVNASQLAFLEK